MSARPDPTLAAWLPLLRAPGGGGGAFAWRDGHLVDGDGREVGRRRGVLELLPPGQLGARDGRWNRFYDLIAPLYRFTERWGARHLLGIDLLAEQRAIVAQVPVRAGMRVLEVSPGPGVFTPALQRAVGPDGQLAALDLSRGMLRQCARRVRGAAPPVLLVHGNGAALPFATGAFDLIFHFGGIRLFDEPARAFAELARVLRPGGVAVVGDEGFSPDLAPDDPRRQRVARLNPGYLEPVPEPPAELRRRREAWVYGGFGFLWTLDRAPAPAASPSPAP